MSAETSDLTKVDSAVSGLSSSPTEEKKIGHRRASSSAAGVYNINDLGTDPYSERSPNLPATRKLNTSPGTLDDKEVLKKFLTTPPVKKIDLHFPLGLEVTARNLKGVTIKDALDAIHKQFKKKADDELELPVLAGFEWDKEESWTRLIVHQKKEGAPSGGGKKKNKKEALED
ncbi:MAG: hypothetical protein LQ344_000465 [Seirophora lacunosa]|nr:MAG: hypothetical protein LQ344_000465 [Seirophora lacunosa]